MIQNPLANIPPVVKNLLIINFICFVPYLLFSNDIYNARVIANMGVFYFNSPNFKMWQIITHMFFHGGWAHIIFNMFALYSFGMAMEYTLGSKRFFNFYFICGLGAIALQMLVQAVEVHNLIGSFTLGGATTNLGTLDAASISKLRDIYGSPMVGASGAIFGLLIGFGMLYPNAELLILFIPVPVKAKYIIPVYILFELYLGIEQYSGDSVAHFAHLGGALIGFIIIKIWGIKRPNNFF